ncbi:CsgG/HfaB family protein [Desulfovibrio mangrovi]|uniref:CsgG/HfaB family protein n=1 Tax=Desulfovibrio mangrovi TaxID=2976983 RepID=UPI0022472A31|nr:CsgG/HfaB family protein [Desulfovibrio mangrovi]UZP66193.1 CsgG/HfaB family protein [Desulfovibrio mangrovi]
MRYVIRRVLRFACVLVMLLLAACAGKKNYDAGMSLYAQGDLRAAVEELTRAVALEPTKQKYLDALRRAKGALASRICLQAQADLEAAEPSRASMDAARAVYDEAQGLDEGNARAGELLRFISSKEIELARQVNADIGAAEQLAAAGRWEDGWQAMLAVERRDPESKVVQVAKTVFGRRGAVALAQAADAFYVSGQFGEAKRMIALANEMDPANMQVSTMLANATRMVNKMDLVRKGDGALGAGDYSAAARAYMAAHALDPADARLTQHMHNVLTRTYDVIAQKTYRYLSNGFVVAAAHSLAEADEFLSVQPDATIGKLGKQLRRALGDSVETAMDERNYGIAWYCLEQLKRLDPTGDYDMLSFEVEDKLLQRAQTYIAIFDFSSPLNVTGTDAGATITNRLSAYMFEHAGTDVVIMERSSLNRILEEMQLGQVGALNAETSKEMGNLYGVDLAVMGNTLAYRSENTVVQSSKQVSYSRLELQQLSLGQYGSYSIPVSREYTAPYTVNYNKLRTNVQFSYRVVDVETGRHLKSATVNESRVMEDESHGAVPIANLPEDPMELPDELTVLLELTDTAVQKMADDLLSLLNNMEDFYMEKGETYMKRRQADKAAEQFANAVFVERLKKISRRTDEAMKNLDAVLEMYHEE